MTTENRYAMAVPNDDMSPRMRKDESVIFEKGRVPRPDDDVVIVLSTGAYLIRELVSMDESAVQVRTYTPDAATFISIAAIADMFPIISRCFCSLDELLGRFGSPEVSHD
jgi:phage repressor protein C with HTH and peptisase S24 domain